MWRYDETRHTKFRKEKKRRKKFHLTVGDEEINVMWFYTIAHCINRHQPIKQVAIYTNWKAQSIHRKWFRRWTLLLPMKFTVHWLSPLFVHHSKQWIASKMIQFMCNGKHEQRIKLKHAKSIDLIPIVEMFGSVWFGSVWLYYFTSHEPVKSHTLWQQWKKIVKIGKADKNDDSLDEDWNCFW